jgi:hypothetical protein
MTSIMASRYFEVEDDVYVPGRWYLDTPHDESDREVEDWHFTQGHPAQVPAKLRFPIHVPGRPLDFSMAALGIPVVRAELASIFAKLARDDVQILPVVVDGQAEPYHIIVATLIKCIDDRTSKEVAYWTPEDGVPEKIGQYEHVYGLRIDPAKVGDAKVFRTWGWAGTLIVIQEIKEALERVGTTGVKFQEV